MQFNNKYYYCELVNRDCIKHGILLAENMSYAKSQWFEPENVWCKLQFTDVWNGPGI